MAEANLAAIPRLFGHHRAELISAQRAAAMKRRKQFWEALHPQGVSEQIVPKPMGGRPTEFATETSAISVQSKQDINRHLSRAEALGDDLLAVTGGRGYCRIDCAPVALYCDSSA